MLTLRQHIVSLIAVFLALGLGVLAGTTFISPATIKALHTSLDELNRQETSLETQINGLTQQVGSFSAFAGAARDRLVAGALAGRQTVLVSFDTTPSTDVSAVATTLEEAGARIEGSFILVSSKVAMPDDTTRAQVAAALGVTATAGDAVAAALVQHLADALDGRSPGAFQRLLDAGLAHASTVPSPVAPSSVSTPGAAVVILAPVEPSSGSKPSSDLGKSLILPLARDLSTGSALLAIGEDGTGPLPVLSEIRGDSTLRVVTVDGVDTAIGQTDVVLGLQAAAGGVWGDYGSGPGASAVLPSPAPTPSGGPPSSPSPSATGH